MEDEETGVAKRLNIIKICSRHCSQHIDKAIIQTTSYPATWFVSIVDEDKNTPEYRLEHVSQFIKFLNETDWKFPQQFQLIADETKMETEPSSQQCKEISLVCVNYSFILDE